MNSTENPTHSLPLEWQETPFFEASIFWMARQPLDNDALRSAMLEDSELEDERADLLTVLSAPDLDAETRRDFEAALADLEREAQEQRDLLENLPEPREIIPGWYFQVRVTFGQFLPTLEVAHQQVRDRLRGWNLRPLALFFDTPRDAPVWLSKSERKKLLAEFDAVPLLERPEGEERAYLRFYKVLSESAALGVEILDAAHHTEFETVIGAPNDPLKTLVGRKGTLSVLEDPETQTELDWRTLSEGPIALEGSTLRVGTLQLEVLPGEAISGIAYDSAFWDEASSGKRFDLALDPRESGPEPRTPQALEQDEDAS